MATRYSVFNPEGEQYVSDVDRMNRQDQMLRERLAARQQQAAPRPVGRVAAPSRASAPSGNSNFVMVDGIPIPTNYTKLNITGESVADPEATRLAALESAGLMRGTAAERAGYDVDLQGAKNAPGMARVDLARDIADREWEAGAGARDDAAFQRNLRNELRDELMQNPEDRRAYALGGAEGIAARDAAAEAKQQAIAEMLMQSGTHSGRRAGLNRMLPDDPRAVQTLAHDGITQGERDQYREALLGGQRFEDIRSQLGDAIDAGVLPYYDEGDIRDVQTQMDSLYAMMQDPRLNYDDRQKLVAQMEPLMIDMLDQSWSPVDSWGTGEAKKIISDTMRKIRGTPQ